MEAIRLFCHTACNQHGFVLGMIVTPSNIHDSVVFPSLLQTVTEHSANPFAVVADVAYKTLPIAHRRQQDILAVFPYTVSEES
ncbi:transposase [Exiguobacterium sp. SL14]|nr:transposase [Exiguobacterium sp. SL14]MCY1689912.1 transposase [Exiguobacterium sp. SL14]